MIRILALLVAVLCAAPLATAALPEVHLIATGGTISGGKGGPLVADELLELIPAVGEAAQITTENYSRIGSSSMTPELQFGLAQRVNAVFAEKPSLAGIVITHGTDTLEETAFMLDLLVTDERPVVFAAAQRPPRRVDTDGPLNLLNAIRIAGSNHARGLGVLVTLNDEIHGAAMARKTHATAVEAFQSPGAGPLGYVDDGRVYIHHKPVHRLTLTPTRVEPMVDLIQLVAGSDGHQIRAAVAWGAKGIVVETFGRGNVPQRPMEAVKEALDAGVVVVFTTRTRQGRVILYPPANQWGVIGAENLDGLKARMLLCVALGQTSDPTEIQRFYQTLAGDTEVEAEAFLDALAK